MNGLGFMVAAFIFSYQSSVCEDSYLLCPISFSTWVLILRFGGYFVEVNGSPMCFREYSDCKVLVELAMKRMKVEISVGGGKVGDNLFHATHVVVMSLPEIDEKFNEVLNR